MFYSSSRDFLRTARDSLDGFEQRVFTEEFTASMSISAVLLAALESGFDAHRMLAGRKKH